MFGEGLLQKAIIGIPVLLFALTIHEFSHAWAADKFGDPTAKRLGRLTLNPLKHLDLMGTLMIFLSNFTFGWAKPVPVNPMNLRNPRVADFWISAAGPISNLILGFFFGLLFQYAVFSAHTNNEAVIKFLSMSVQLNVALAFFNLLPIFPLDGSHILRNVLPEKYDPFFDKLELFGPFILLFLLVVGGAWYILGPFVVPVQKFFLGMG